MRTVLSPDLRRAVMERDRWRCRWCGRTGIGVDLHHITYRRGESYDRADNLIALCRAHHAFVHGYPNGAGQRISKRVAQLVLHQLIEHPGTVGNTVWRRLRRAWHLEGKCDHGQSSDECLTCSIQSV